LAAPFREKKKVAGYALPEQEQFLLGLGRITDEGQESYLAILPCILPYQTVEIMGFNMEERIGYPAQPGLICLSVCPSVCLSVRPSVCPSVRPSVCLSVHACRFDIERKMAQAQQNQSIILQNHEST